VEATPAAKYFASPHIHVESYLSVLLVISNYFCHSSPFQPASNNSSFTLSFWQQRIAVHFVFPTVCHQRRFNPFHNYPTGYVLGRKILNQVPNILNVATTSNTSAWDLLEALKGSLNATDQAF
jgi:hypothetical protein